MPASISITVNGEALALQVDPQATLLDVLRDTLDLTGTKKGCDEGTCGSCTVLLDGRPILSCIYLAVLADGKEVTTIEGLSEDGQLDPIQQSLVDNGAVQCGYCTPGMTMSIKGFLDRNPAAPDRREIKEALAGNICRCTGYVKIIDAVEQLSQERSV